MVEALVMRVDYLDRNRLFVAGLRMLGLCLRTKIADSFARAWIFWRDRNLGRNVSSLKWTPENKLVSTSGTRSSGLRN